MTLLPLKLLALCFVVTNQEKIWFPVGDLEANQTIALEGVPVEVAVERVAAGEREHLPELVARGVARLALSLETALSKSKDGVHANLFSPLSIALALALVLLGASGRTHTEITHLLGLPNDTSPAVVEELHREFGSLFRIVDESASGGVLMSLASGVFVQQGFPINETYMNRSQELYLSTVMPLDFLNQGQQAIHNINTWVMNQTNNHIANLLTEPLSLDTKVVVVNAIYFNGAWQTPFLPQYTSKQKFLVSPKKHVMVDMMVGSAEAFYYGDSEKKVIGLPYRSNTTVMYFVVPKGPLENLLATLDGQGIHQLVENSTYMMSIYAVPRMKLERTFNVKDALESLGVRRLFTGEAELSGLAKGVYASSVVHKVEVLVTELGTVASAATAVDLVRGGIPIVRVDKPFIFFIYHRPTRIVSFWGTVNQPTPF